MAPAGIGLCTPKNSVARRLGEEGVASSSILKNLSNYGRWPPFTLFLLMNSWSRVDTNLDMRFLLSRFRVVIDTAALLWVPPSIHEPRLGNDQVATRKSAQSEVPLRITPTPA